MTCTFQRWSLTPPKRRERVRILYCANFGNGDLIDEVLSIADRSGCSVSLFGAIHGNRMGVRVLRSLFAHHEVDGHRYCGHAADSTMEHFAARSTALITDAISFHRFRDFIERHELPCAVYSPVEHTGESDPSVTVPTVCSKSELHRWLSRVLLLSTRPSEDRRLIADSLY